MLEIVKTADGSNTIYNAEIGENYHSKHGALQESRHVFVNSGLCYYLDMAVKPAIQASSKSPPPGGGETLAAPPVSFKVSSPLDEIDLDNTGGQQPTAGGGGVLKKSEVQVFPPTGGGDSERANTQVSILEVGFGTGLNFLLSADHCMDKGIALDYAGIEAYPLSLEMISQTGYEQYVSEELWHNFVGNYDELFRAPVLLNPNCKLQIANCKLLDFQSEKQYDIIYFDAFASARQPEMWDDDAISHTIKFLKPGGVFVTYAITGNLKRALKALGCKIEKAPGAPGKREMLRAVKLL